jgi:Fe2+ transport system protein FeoA
VGRVVDVGAAEGDAAVLKSLGICGGQRVRLIRTGDPLVVYVVGARIGLSARLASVVLVETEVALKGVE